MVRLLSSGGLAPSPKKPAPCEHESGRPELDFSNLRAKRNNPYGSLFPEAKMPSTNGFDVNDWGSLGGANGGAPHPRQPETGMSPPSRPPNQSKTCRSPGYASVGPVREPLGLSDVPVSSEPSPGMPPVWQTNDAAQYHGAPAYSNREGGEEEVPPLRLGRRAETETDSLSGSLKPPRTARQPSEGSNGPSAHIKPQRMERELGRRRPKRGHDKQPEPVTTRNGRRRIE